MARTKHTVKLDDGRVEQRVSESRAYTHAIILEVTPAEKASDIASAEQHLAERKAVVERLTEPGSTKAAKAEYASILALEEYWHARVPGRAGAETDRWLTLSRYAHDLKSQEEVDAHYARLREHIDYIPEGLDHDGRNIRALVLSTPTLLGLKAEDSDYRGDWRKRKVFVAGLDISGLVSHLRYSHPVYKLEDARNRLRGAEKSLQGARDLTVGAASQTVYGWAQSKRNADNRVAAEKSKRPLAHVFARESDIAAPVASRKKRG